MSEYKYVVSRTFDKCNVDTECAGLYRHKTLNYLVYFVDFCHGFTLTDLSNSQYKGLRERKMGILYRWSKVDGDQWIRVNVEGVSDIEEGGQ